MKKKLIIIFLATALCAGCDSKNASDTEVNNQNQTQEAAEVVHTHNYVEAITTEVSCEVDGVKTFTCECGDSYTEVIVAKGHIYENYVSNNDATYLAEGTETAVCQGCDLTDTRTVEGSKLEYTYTDMDKTMYAAKAVNVRDLPMKEGNKLGTLSTAQEVKVTGQCNETNWYRIEYNGNAAYVSNNNLAEEKPVEQVIQPEQPLQPEQPTQPEQVSQPASDATVANTNTVPSAGDEVCPYPLYVILYDNQGFPYFYGKYGGSANMDADNLAKTDACMAEMDSYVDKNFPRAEWQYGIDYFNSISWKSIGRYEGMQVVVRYMGHLHGESLSKPEERGIPTAGNKIFKK